MNFSTLLATAAASCLLAGAAIAADVDVTSETTIDHSKNGGYDKTTTNSKSTPAGKVSDSSETKLNVSNNGDSEKTTTVKHVNDPKGLLNKHTDKTTTTEKNTDGSTSTERTHKVDGKTVSDSTTSTDTSK